MARDRDGLSGLWAEASPLQRSEVTRMRDQHGVYASALYDAVAEAMREKGGLAFHEQVEAEVARRLAVAAMKVGGALPEPVETRAEHWKRDPVILGLFGPVPPEGQRFGWRPGDADG